MLPPRVFSAKTPQPPEELFELLYEIFYKMPQPRHYGIHCDKGLVPKSEPARFPPSELPALFPKTMPPAGTLVYEADWTLSGTRKHGIVVVASHIIATNDKLKPRSKMALSLRQLRSSNLPMQAHADAFVEFLRRGMPQASPGK